MLIKSHILESLIFFIIYFSLVVHCNIIQKSHQVEEIENGPPGLSPREGELLGALNEPTIQPKNLDDRLESIFREDVVKFVFEHSSKDLEQLTPEERLQMKESWVKNGNQVISIDKDSSELSVIIEELREDLSLLKPLIVDHPTRMREERLSNSIDELELIQGKLITIKRMRYCDLAKMDLPVWKIVGIPYGNRILLELNQKIPKSPLFVDDNIHYDIEFDNLLALWWNGVIKLVDFLSKYDFADQHTVRFFFQNSETIKQLIHYADEIFSKKLQYSPLTSGSPYLTKHWFWKDSLGLVKALSTEQETLINSRLLLEIRHGEHLELPLHFDPPYTELWREFLETFEKNQYLPFLRAKENPQSYHELYKDLFIMNKAIEQGEKIIRLLINRVYAVQESTESVSLKNEELVRHLHNILEFLETNFLHGMIDKIMSLNPTFQKYELQIRLYILKYKFEYQKMQSTDFFLQVVSETSSSDWKKKNSPNFSAEGTYLIHECVALLENPAATDNLATRNEILELKEQIRRWHGDVQSEFQDSEVMRTPQDQQYASTHAGRNVDSPR